MPFQPAKSAARFEPSRLNDLEEENQEEDLTIVAPNSALEAGLKYKRRECCARELGAITRGAGSELAINAQGRIMSVVWKDGPEGRVPDTRLMSARLASDEQRYIAVAKLWANNQKELACEYVDDAEKDLAEAQATIASQAKEIEALQTLRKMHQNNTGVVVKQRNALEAENAALKAEIAALKKAEEEAESRGACVVCMSNKKTWVFTKCGHLCVCLQCVSGFCCPPSSFTNLSPDAWRGKCPMCRIDGPVRQCYGA